MKGYTTFFGPHTLQATFLINHIQDVLSSSTYSRIYSITQSTFFRTGHASIQVQCKLTVLCSETRPNAKPENVSLFPNTELVATLPAPWPGWEQSAFFHLCTYMKPPLKKRVNHDSGPLLSQISFLPNAQFPNLALRSPAVLVALFSSFRAAPTE